VSLRRAALSGFLSNFLLKRGASLTFARKTPIVTGLVLATSIIGANFMSSPALIISFMTLAFFGSGLAGVNSTLHRRRHDAYEQNDRAHLRQGRVPQVESSTSPLLHVDAVGGDCHLNCRRAARNPERVWRDDHAACRAQVSRCQTLNALGRIAR
jgi:hypothetical protein